QQALAAGQDFRVVPVVGERREGFVQRGRSQVVELGRDHWSAPSVLLRPGSDSSKCGIAAPGVAVEPAPCRAFQTRSGVQGIWMSFTPKCRMASTTAFTTAGVEAIVPA